MTSTDIRHLWEVDHPYYCQEGNYFKTGQHTTFASWAHFVEDTVFVTADRDQNFLIRWDWHTDRTPGEPLVRGIDGDDRLLLFFVLQRKAWLCSVEITVTEADEPAVRKFLAECAETMRATWEPLLDLPAA